MIQTQQYSVDKSEDMDIPKILNRLLCQLSKALINLQQFCVIPKWYYDTTFSI